VNVVDSADQFQRRHPVLGFPIAVVYKYFNDQGPFLAATLTYYAFVAIFPLMLLGTSVLGLLLRGEPQWQEAVLDSALGQFPIIGDELGRPEGLQGSVTGITVGALGALYGSLGLGQALQNTQHVAWSVPRNSRPNPFLSRLKSLGLLVVAGLALGAVTVLTTLISTSAILGDALGDRERWLITVLSVLLVGGFLTLLFRFAATGDHISVRRSAPGGFGLALMWQLLQLGGARYVDNVLVDTSAMTKTFGLVLGLIGFLFIGAAMAVLATELNVVSTRRLWPRALLTPFTDNVALTDADRRAYALYAGMQRHKGFETVEVSWAPSPKERQDPTLTDLPVVEAGHGHDWEDPRGRRREDADPEPGEEARVTRSSGS